MDTAGIRDASNKIEKEGVKLSKKALKGADIVIYLAENESDFDKMPVFKRKKNIFVINKIDISNKKAPTGGLAVSAKTKKNIKSLKKELAKSFLEFSQEEILSVNLRHLGLIDRSYKKVTLISPALISSNLELVAENLKCCDDLLGQIYDPISSDDMLGKIFSKFCIGK
jgi:tRNA modification GTPase